MSRSALRGILSGSGGGDSHDVQVVRHEKARDPRQHSRGGALLWGSRLSDLHIPPNMYAIGRFEVAAFRKICRKRRIISKFQHIPPIYVPKSTFAEKKTFATVLPITARELQTPKRTAQVWQVWQVWRVWQV